MSKQMRLLGLPVVAVIACLLLGSTGAGAASGLKEKDARKLISRVAGIELPSSAVRIKTISSTDATTAEVVAQVEAAFRLVQQGADECWRVAEVRAGDNRWEDVDEILLAAGSTERDAQACDEPNPSGLAARPRSELDARLARCVIAGLFGVTLPSDAVRVKEVEPLSLPLSNSPSASVVAQVEMQFRFKRDAGKWQVAQVRAGQGEWRGVDQIVSAINRQKSERAHADLEALRAALEAFRRERGFYVVAKTEGVLVDQLAPRYLARIIRVDPWHKPYNYEGTRDDFTLRSNGADGLPDTADDIIIKR